MSIAHDPKFYLNRMIQIKSLHDNGMTYAEIGHIFGISVSRVRAIYVKAERMTRHPEEKESYMRYLSQRYPKMRNGGENEIS